MALAWAAHHWKYCFREQRSLVTFAYNCAHIVPRNLVNRVVGAHFSFIVLKQRNHEVKLPLARPHCPAMAGRRRVAEPAGVVSKYRSQMAGAEMVPSVPVRRQTGAEDRRTDGRIDWGGRTSVWKARGYGHSKKNIKARLLFAC